MKTPSIDRMVDSVKLILVILVACLLVSVIILLVSTEPGIAIYSFFIGPFTSLRRIGNILEGAIPLMFTALAVIIIFRSGQFSMISEGSFFIGILGAMMVGISFDLPSGLHPLVAILCAGLLGAMAAAIPAFLKLRWKVSEVVTSIMLNYVIQFFVIYMVNYHFREPLASSLASLLIKDTSRLPVLIPGTKVHLGLLIALAFCALVWFFIFRMKTGYKIRLVGDNPSFSRYVGIKTSMVIVSAQVIAGAIAGIGGGIEFLGMYTRFKWTSSPGYGWTGIAVALLARSNPMLVPVAALFIAYLNVGSGIMARSSDVSSEIVLIIQGVIMLLIASDALLQGWRQRLIVSSATKEGGNF
ncbi:ABC transporter permease [uncultured Sphaerochaeta sp.]|uniref:ABC transporter permease n=1 Tax=uncultured Sphaerochaeta sp. TaxID=886478 RepID=UPI002A0A72CE|nr:ABC transporter permease [uncultured Sphaerochaeta sp.]